MHGPAHSPHEDLCLVCSVVEILCVCVEGGGAHRLFSPSLAFGGLLERLRRGQHVEPRCTQTGVVAGAADSVSFLMPLSLRPLEGWRPESCDRSWRTRWRYCGPPRASLISVGFWPLRVGTQGQSRQAPVNRQWRRRRRSLHGARSRPPASYARPASPETARYRARHAGTRGACGSRPTFEGPEC